MFFNTALSHAASEIVMALPPSNYDGGDNFSGLGAGWPYSGFCIEETTGFEGSW